MPKPTHFPSGPIVVADQHLLDMSAGMNWDMRDASNVRFLAVRGTIWVGDCQTTYNFTLVEYQLYIDEVPWLLFSTLADVLEKEFIPGFWETVNHSRKERWGFLELPWDGKAYGVAPPYTEIRLSIFNDIAHTMRVVHPFVWNHTHLKVHPNGAAIFHEQKKLAFLLPLIVEAHELLPPTPLFWVNDDNTIPLWRTTLWLHEDTIQWLAETGESYPPELRDEIQPRLNQLKPSQHAKCHNLRLHRNQPGGRTELQQNSRYKHYKKPLHRTRRVLRTRHNRWLIENGNIWNCNLSLLKQTNGRWQTADQRIPNKPKNQPICWPLVNKAQTTLQPPYQTNPSTGVAAEAPAPQESNRPPKVSAQSLFSQRPGPPSTPPTSKSKTDTPGTGVLSSDSQPATHNKGEEQQQPQEEQSAVDNDTPTEESLPADTPNESPETQATDTVVASSPEPTSESRQNVDLAAADIPTLQNMEKAACERVAFHETRLASAREHLTRIKKRLKRMQDGQSPGTPQASPVADLEMEIID